MRDVNKVTLMGRVVRDGQLKMFSDGTGVLSFSVATGEKWKGKGGETKEKTQYHYCKLFGSLAESLGSYITKGKPVYIEGKINYEEYMDSKNEKHHVTVIRVEEISLLGDGKQGGEPGQSRGRARSGQSDEPIAAGPADDDIPF